MTPPTPNQPTKLALHIPVKVGLVGQSNEALSFTFDGQTQDEVVLHVNDVEQTFVFENVMSKPVPSLLRGFSAPVKLDYDYSTEQLLQLMSGDPDGFNRWSASQQLAVNELNKLIAQYQNGAQFSEETPLVEGFKALLADESLDPAMVALILGLPSQAYMSELADKIDPQAIKAAREHLRGIAAKALEVEFKHVYESNTSSEAYQASAEQIAKRSLKNAALSYWVASGSDEAKAAVVRQYRNADNMTDQFAALSCVVHFNLAEADELLNAFFEQWKHEALVVNKWLMLSAAREQENGLEQVKALMEHPSFDIKNPNKLRSVIGGLGQNVDAFHNLDGSGYAFLADQIILLNKRNPQIASRLCTPLTRWQRMVPALAEKMKGELERIAREDLSKDVYEVVSKSLA